MSLVRLCRDDIDVVWEQFGAYIGGHVRNPIKGIRASDHHLQRPKLRRQLGLPPSRILRAQPYPRLLLRSSRAQVEPPTMVMRSRGKLNCGQISHFLT